MGFPGAAKRLESARQPRERALLRAMRARHRGSGLPIATKTAIKPRGSSRSLVARPGLTVARPAPSPRSRPGPHRAGGARRRPAQPPRAGSPRPPSGPPIARLGRESLQLCPRRKGQGDKLLRLLLRPPSRRDASGCGYGRLRKPLLIPPHPFGSSRRVAGVHFYRQFRGCRVGLASQYEPLRLLTASPWIERRPWGSRGRRHCHLPPASALGSARPSATGAASTASLSIRAG